jgi:hypothetical protein
MPIELVTLKQILFLIFISLPICYLIYKVRNNSLFDLFLFVFIIICYILVHHKFVFGTQYPFHDTAWTYHVLYSVIYQWIDNGFSIGWNPFMNGGEPLFIFSNYFLWAEFFLLSILNKLIFNQPIDLLVNLFFTYFFISYFSFSFILFSILFKERTIVFFPFVILVFSGITYSNLVQPAIMPLYFLPLIIISLYLFFAKKNVNYLFSALFLTCISVNHYLPHYLVFFIIVFISIWIITVFIIKIIKKRNGNHLAVIAPLRQLNKKYASLMLIASLFVVLPVSYVYNELADYTSPTRGGKLGEIENFKGVTNLQPGVFHPLSHYKYLIDMPENTSNPAYHHSVYYIGSIALLFFFLALLGIKKIVDITFFMTLITTLCVLVYFSLEHNLLWNLLNKHVDLFFLRHSFPFANIITFLIIIGATFGFMYSIKTKQLRYAIIVITPILSVYPVIKYSQYESIPLFKLSPFQYPQQRSLYSEQLVPIPFDFTPLILKQAAATHPSDNFIFFRKDDYHKLLKNGIGTAIGKLFLFTPTLSNNILVEPLSITNDSFGLWKPYDSYRLLEGDVHYYQTGAGGKVIANTVEKTKIESKNPSLSIYPSTEGNSYVRYTFNQLDESMYNKTIRFSIWVKSKNVVPNAIQIDIQTNISNQTVLASYENTNDWEKIVVEKIITKQDNIIYLTLNVKNSASSMAHFAQIEAELYSFDDTPIPIIYLQDKDPNHLQFKAQIPQDGYLIRKENFHAGWRAKVNNIDTPIIKYADVFQAIKVNKGMMIIDFKFYSLYPVLMWLHIIFVFIGYLVFFRYLVIMRE